MMCKGDNKAVIDALQGSPGTQGFGIQITFPIIMCAISDADIKELHPDLRAMLVELLKGWLLWTESYLKLIAIKQHSLSLYTCMRLVTVVWMRQ